MGGLKLSCHCSPPLAGNADSESVARFALVAKPRVLFVGRTRYRLPLSESLSRKWDALAEELDCRVLATAAAGSSGAGDERFRLVGDGPGVAFYAALPFRIAGEVRRFRPDAIVAQSPYEALAALAGRALGHRRAKVVLEVHGDWRTLARLYGSPLRRLAAPVADRLAALAVRRADAVRALSPFTIELVRSYGAEPAAAFATYSDLSAFADPPVQPLPVDPSVLFVGVLERYKNLDGLAAAWRLAAPRAPGARLRIVGKGRERAIVERLVSDLPTQTEWTPELTPTEVVRALDESSLLVLPSRSEGLPRVALEALLRGRPVVGARAGGIPDAVQHETNGLLVAVGDPQALADALVRALADRALLERLAAAARASVAQWMQTADEYARNVRELVEP